MEFIIITTLELFVETAKLNNNTVNINNKILNSITQYTSKITKTLTIQYHNKHIITSIKNSNSLDYLHKINMKKKKIHR